MQATFAYAIKLVADMDKAVAFYRDTFGLTLRFTTPFWSEFDTGAVTLALHPASELHPAGSTDIGFSVPDLAQVYAGREAAGLDFAAPPKDEHGTPLAVIRDCEGAEVSLSGAP